MVPDCFSKVIHLRGLCRSCYGFASSLVRHHLTTWAAMEAAGCVLPTQGQFQSPKRPARMEFFSKAAGRTPEALKVELRLRISEYEKRRQR